KISAQIVKNIKGKRKNSAEKVKIILLILCPSTRQAAGNMAAGGRRAQKKPGRIGIRPGCNGANVANALL
ncbi:MAG: hypothetical protein ACOCM7_03945, partial [Bacteroidales bacterium]